MSFKFIITNEAARGKAIAILRNLTLEKPMEFSLKAYRRDRSIEQNARYWKLLRKWSELGQPAEEIHQRMKLKFLIPMLHSDEDNSSWQLEVEAVKELRRRGQSQIADFWKNRMIAKASTADLNTKQFTEYMESVEGEAAMDGIALNPEEYAD